MEQDKDVNASENDTQDTLVNDDSVVVENVLDTDEPLESAATAEPTPEKMQLLLEDARAKADEHWELLLRERAELENFKKRHDREIENAHKYAIDKFVNELLPVKDSMELGLNAAAGENADLAKLIEGTELTLKLLADVMGKFGIEEIDPTGQPFNPELHQAMSMQPSADAEPNTVITVFQKGYTLNGRLVRPAMVVVAK